MTVGSEEFRLRLKDVVLSPGELVVIVSDDDSHDETPRPTTPDIVQSSQLEKGRCKRCLKIFNLRPKCVLQLFLEFWGEGLSRRCSRVQLDRGSAVVAIQT